MAERLYLDSCVLNRPTDDQSQERVRLESAAITRILDASVTGQVHWIASSLLVYELSRNPDAQRRGDALDLVRLAAETVIPAPDSIQQAKILQLQGYDVLDALHLTLASQAGASALLTVDDRFIRLAGRSPVEGLPTVENPIDWLRRRNPWLIKR